MSSGAGPEVGLFPGCCHMGIAGWRKVWEEGDTMKARERGGLGAAEGRGRGDPDITASLSGRVMWGFPGECRQCARGISLTSVTCTGT